MTEYLLIATVLLLIAVFLKEQIEPKHRESVPHERQGVPSEHHHEETLATESALVVPPIGFSASGPGNDGPPQDNSLPINRFATTYHGVRAAVMHNLG